MKRREFIAKCGAGLAAIIAAGKAPAAVVRSMLAARSCGSEDSSPQPLKEVQWLESTGSSYYSFDIEDAESGANQDVEIEWTMQITKNQAYRTLMDFTPNTRNASVVVNSIDGINTVTGLAISKYRDYSTDFSKYKIARISNQVSLSIDDEVVYTTTGQYAVFMTYAYIFCRGDITTWTLAPAGWKFGYCKAKLQSGDVDIRAARIGRKGVLYDAITKTVHESIGATSAIPGPDIGDIAI